LIFHVQENPIMMGPSEVGWAELIGAVLVCSLSPESFLNPSKFRRWRMMPWNRWWIHGASRRYNLAEEAKKFENYVDDHYTKPRFWGDGDDEVKAPWVLSIAAYIESNSNMTEKEVMTASCGRMFWKSAAIAEQQGSGKMDIVSEEEEEAMKQLELL
jgi:hypothetical protein